MLSQYRCQRLQAHLMDTVLTIHMPHLAIPHTSWVIQVNQHCQGSHPRQLNRMYSVRVQTRQRFFLDRISHQRAILGQSAINQKLVLMKMYRNWGDYRSPPEASGRVFLAFRTNDTRLFWLSLCIFVPGRNARLKSMNMFALCKKIG